MTLARKALFANVKADPKYGEGVQWPQHPAILTAGVAKLRLVWRNWWAYKKVTSLSPEQQNAMRQKIAGYDLFHGRKAW